MSETVNMPAGFRAAFELVCENYRCTEEEIRFMRSHARANPEEAVICYFALQEEIREEVKKGWIEISPADMVIEPHKEREKARAQ
jgi:hypothetical protein